MIKQIIGLLFLLISLNLFAQRNNNSPYSFFGIGDLAGEKTVEELGMGEVGGAFNSTFQLSFTNPASLAHLRLTNYALAGQNRAIQLNDGTNKDTGSNAALSYFALAFPIGNNAGFAFGLKPSTTVGYSLLQQTFENDNLIEINEFNGEGGTNRVFVAFGHKIGKNLSLGIEGDYTFGSIENNLLNRRDGVPLATLYKSDSDVRGFSVKGGAQYQAKVNDNLTLKTGAVVEFSNELSNEGGEFLISVLNIENPTPFQYRDTTLNNDFDRNFEIPIKTILSAGIGQENKWYAGVEYEFQEALNVDDTFSQGTVSLNYKKSSRISVGGYFTPKFNSITSYWQRATYRAGLRFKKTGLVISNTEINDFGISFGVGLPMGKQLSKINVGVELGQRGEANNGLVRENYLNFRVGLSLSDRWFRKRNID